MCWDRVGTAHATTSDLYRRPCVLRPGSDDVSHSGAVVGTPAVRRHWPPSHGDRREPARGTEGERRGPRAGPTPNVTRFIIRYMLSGRGIIVQMINPVPCLAWPD